MAPWDAYVVGVVRVPVALLAFSPDDGPQTTANVAATVTNAPLDRYDPIHQIQGKVSSRTHRDILEALNLPKEELRQTVFSDDFPLLAGQFEIECTSGWRYIETLERLRGDDAWWTVRLHVFPQDSPLESLFMRRDIKCVSYDFSDGEICRNIIHATVERSHNLAEEWIEKLDVKKRVYLKQLLSHGDIVMAMDRLVPFPGLWTDLKLGNWPTILALRMKEQIVRFWEHLFRVWSHIFKNRPSLRKFADTETVRLVEFRAPSASTDDWEFIKSTMRQGQLVRGISDPARRLEIEQNILSLEVVIPSIASFHKNISYIAMGARILQRYIEVKPAMLGVGVKRASQSLYKSFLNCYDKHQQPVVEVSTGRFRSLLHPVSAEFMFAQLFLGTLRDSVLSDDSCLDRIYGRATILGFRIESERQGMDRDATFLSEAKQAGRLKGRRVDGSRSGGSVQFPTWRGGKPFANMAAELAASSFMMESAQVYAVTDCPAPAFIHQDLIMSFFGTFMFQVDYSRPLVEWDNSIQTKSAKRRIPGPEDMTKGLIRKSDLEQAAKQARGNVSRARGRRRRPTIKLAGSVTAKKGRVRPYTGAGAVKTQIGLRAGYDQASSPLCSVPASARSLTSAIELVPFQSRATLSESNAMGESPHFGAFRLETSEHAGHSATQREIPVNGSRQEIANSGAEGLMTNSTWNNMPPPIDVETASFATPIPETTPVSVGMNWPRTP